MWTRIETCDTSSSIWPCMETKDQRLFVGQQTQYQPRPRIPSGRRPACCKRFQESSRRL
jgi:hypothetical protein